ncbi:MFS transporter [Pseudalkalibacillus berkeleyi]|uniref:MFS transporter n=1 Tax=Pseudalkalibacillus berkeleyi TaxID=1069813 RepID=A0ABS9H3J8_9BACL|nr:MFS transporter [Pseudalkalibacillus berkeleyi]MCF6139527.1 MFS transporter [Pseudalkalibacillus berkeleyi]
MSEWKKPILLISAIGVSQIGNWIYLIALNITILDLTGSAAAVAGLYIIRPIAILLTNTWSGSVIDRVNKRKLMIFIDIVRGILVFTIPFIGELWIIYLLLLLINTFGTFFGPVSSVYITKLIPYQRRKRFNSIMSMTGSGAFLTGPATAGVLIIYFGTELCIIINAATFMICAFFIFLLPNVDENTNGARDPIGWKTIVNDWKVVEMFSIKAKYFLVVYILFQSAMLIGFALDSQEVTFIKQNLELSDRDYGFIVSLTGLGAISGGIFSAMATKKIPLKFYLGVGMLLTSLGYVMFYSSINFITATIAFVFLGFFMAFANTGFATYFQNNVPVEIMGRFGSITDMIQGIIQIGFTLILGFLAEWFSLQFICIVFSLVGTFMALVLLTIILKSPSSSYFNENSKVING